MESTPGTWLVLGTRPPGTGTFRITCALVGSILSLGVTYRVRVRVTAIAGSRWASAPSTTTAISTLSVLGIGLVVACA